MAGNRKRNCFDLRRKNAFETVENPHSRPERHTPHPAQQVGIRIPGKGKERLQRLKGWRVVQA